MDVKLLYFVRFFVGHERPSCQQLRAHDEASCIWVTKGARHSSTSAWEITTRISVIKRYLITLAAYESIRNKGRLCVRSRTISNVVSVSWRKSLTMAQWEGERGGGRFGCYLSGTLWFVKYTQPPFWGTDVVAPRFLRVKK